MFKQLFLTGLEESFNRYVQLDPDTVAKLPQLADKILLVELEGLEVKFFMQFTPRRVNFLEHYALEPTATLVGTPYSLAKLGLTEREKVNAVFANDVKMIGDIECAEQVKTLLDQFDIDWEEHVAKIIGDVAAHQLGNVSRQVKSFARGAVGSMQENITEYVQFETQLLPSRREVETFINDIDQLRLDVDRLDAKIQPLES